MKKVSRKKMVFGILLGLTLLLAGGSVLYANFGPRFGPGFHNPEMHAGWVRYYLTKELDLDASQQQKLESMTQELLAKGSDLHQLRMTARQEVLSILRADSVDRERIEQLAAQHQEEISGFIAAVGSRLTDFVDMLTPEQRQRLAQAIENHAGCARFH